MNLAELSDIAPVTSLVVFRLDEQRYALPLHAVERVVRAVLITPLPGAPDVVLGVIDVQGRIMPVFNVRARFRLPQRPVDPEQQFMIAHTQRRAAALVIDEALGLLQRPANEVMAASQLTTTGLAHLQGIVKLSDGMVLIHDLEHFLDAAESATLDAALAKERHRES